MEDCTVPSLMDHFHRIIVSLKFQELIVLPFTFVSMVFILHYLNLSSLLISQLVMMSASL